MPTRVIREGINYSEVINQLSDSGELFYRRLLHVADDYGRYWNDVDMIRTQTGFHKKRSPWSRKKVSRALRECFASKSVLVYGQGKYLCIPKNKQQVHRKSKFPEPPREFLMIGCTADSALKNVPENHSAMSIGGGGGEAGDALKENVQVPPAQGGETKEAERPPAQQPAHGERVNPDSVPGVAARSTTDLKTALNGLYKRPAEQAWSYEEECGLIELSRRADCFGELQLIVGYRRRMSVEDRRFFPSLSRLLNDWNATLDRARATRPPVLRQEATQGKPPAQRPAGMIELTDERRAEMEGKIKELRDKLSGKTDENPS